MKTWKRACAVVLGAATVLSSLLLSACGGRKYDPDNFLPEGTQENPYQIVKERATIKIFVPRGTMNPHYSEMKMFKVLSEVTNLNFEFTEADTAAYSTLRSAAWGDRDNLPDLFLFSNSISEQVVYSQYGALVRFNDDNLSSGGVQAGNLIDNYMPHYKALLDDNFHIQTTTSAKEVATLPDGYMYCTLSVNDVPRDLTFKMFLNQQWIENLREDGRTMPDGKAIPDAVDIKTVEEFIDVLRLFKNYDANHNGNPNDEIPVTAKELSYLRNFILAACGYVTPEIEVKNDGSDVVFVPQTDAYKKYLEIMNVLYSEGLLHSETFSIKTDQQLARYGLEGRLGCYCAAAPYIIVGDSLADDYVAFGPLTSEYYTGTPLQWGFSYFQPDGAVIPAGTPYVREVARLLDIMYSDLGVQLISYGLENEDWTWDNEEKTSWTFHVPDTWTGTQEEYRATITPNVGTASGLYWSYDFVGKMNDKTISSLNKMSERYIPYLKVPIPQEVKLGGSDYDTVTTISAGMNVYINSMEYDFITGAKELDTEWEGFQARLKQYRADEMLALYSKAYKQYLAAKN